MHAPFDTSVIQRLFTQLSHNRICDLHMQNRPYFARKGPHISTKLGHTHTHTRTSETLYQSAPKSNAFISRHHPSSKLALKWWSFIKAATARKNSIVISVLGEELKRRGGFFFSTVCWLIEDFSQNGLRGRGDRLWWVVRGFILFISVYSQDNDPIFSIIKGVVHRNCYRRTLWGNVF